MLNAAKKNRAISDLTLAGKAEGHDEREAERRRIVKEAVAEQWAEAEEREEREGYEQHARSCRYPGC